MNKTKTLLLVAGMAAVGLALIALPSPSAMKQDKNKPAIVEENRVIMRSDDEPLIREEFTLPFDEEGASWLGVETHEVTAEKAKELRLSAERGVVLGKIIADSPAAKAGLKPDDVVTELNGQRVEGAAQFRRMIREIPAGRTAQLTVWREGRSQTINVALGKAAETNHMWMKSAPGAFAFHMPEVSPMPEMLEAPGMEQFGFGPSAHPRLGIDAEDLGGQLAAYFGVPEGEGILVRSVNSGSPAEKAGVQSGDVITSVNGERVRSVGELREKLAAKNDAKNVQLGVLRNKAETKLSVELPPPPQKQFYKMGHRTNI
jgi:serine protease Do